MSDNIKKAAVLVVSCDKYSDLWRPFFELFWRFWPDCPFSIYLLSNNKIEEFPNVTNIAVGEDKSWSDNVLLALDKISEDYIIMHLEDLFFYEKIDNKGVVELVDWSVSANVDYMRFNPNPGPDKKHNELVGVVSKGSEYRTSTVMSLWRKDVLRDLLKPGESAWDFEIIGSSRSDKYDGFYSAYESFLPTFNGVIKGKWFRSSVRKMKDLNVDIDLGKREVLSFWESFVVWFLNVRSMILRWFPAKYQARIKEMFKKMLG